MRRNPRPTPSGISPVWSPMPALAVLLALTVFPPPTAHAQCVVASVGYFPVCSAGMDQGMITLTGLPNCVVTFSNNVDSCFQGSLSGGFFGCPAGVPQCRLLVGGVASGTVCPLPAVPRTCRWQCTGCPGTVTITMTNADGLPVELLEFSVESADAEAGDTTEDAEPEPDAGG